MIHSDNNSFSRPVRIVPPFPFTYLFRVKPKEEGMTLLDFLLIRFPFRSPEAWTERINSGSILVDAALADGNFILHPNMLISHHNARVVEPSVPDEIRILEETENFLAVFKPAPMPIHPGGRYNKNSLHFILEEKGFGNLHILHRLDAVTSGIVLLGKTVPFAQKAQELFTNGGVQKTYAAIVAGEPEMDVFECDQSIIRDKGYRFRCGNEPGAKSARTLFRVLKRNGENSIIECTPITGRTHQIRLHLQAYGFPIIDDPVYGPKASENTAPNRSISLRHIKLDIPALGVCVSCEAAF